MASTSTYLNFKDETEAAFNFYKSVFGGEFAKIIRFKDISNPEFPIADSDANKLMHIALPIGKNVLIGNDVPEFMGKVNENEPETKAPLTREAVLKTLGISRNELYDLFFKKH